MMKTRLDITEIGASAGGVEAVTLAYDSSSDVLWQTSNEIAHGGKYRFRRTVLTSQQHKAAGLLLTLIDIKPAPVGSL